MKMISYKHALKKKIGLPFFALAFLAMGCNNDVGRYQFSPDNKGIIIDTKTGKVYKLDTEDEKRIWVEFVSEVKDTNSANN